MLSRLRIENFALIDKLEIEFHKGLNVITGSTGAGKSIIISALELALGGKTSTEMIRTGASSLTVEATFNFDSTDDLDPIAGQFDIPVNDRQISIRREYRKKGTGRALANGKPISISALREISQNLASILGQHSHQTLLNPQSHLGFLDSYAVSDDKLEKLRALYHRALDLKERIEYSQRFAAEIADQIDLLSFQIEEIEKAKLIPGEEEQLKTEKIILENAQLIRDLGDLVCSTIVESDDSIVGRIGELEKSLKELPEDNKDVKDIVGKLKSSVELLNETSAAMRNLADKSEDDPARLEEINERLHEVFRLKKKYGGGIEVILGHLDELKSRLAALREKGGDTSALEKEFAKARDDLNRTSREISRLRNTGKESLEKFISDRLSLMGMPKARFVVDIRTCEDPSGLYGIDGRSMKGDASGFDIVEFLFCANPGEDLKPLARTASGGEISRVMLAMKNALIRKQSGGCEVFDEIDVGISGEVASRIGSQLKELAGSHQVICITHLHQIASVADNHYRVYKEKSGKRSITLIRKLDREERIREIASLISGRKITQKALEGAREMLDNLS